MHEKNYVNVFENSELYFILHLESMLSDRVLFNISYIYFKCIYIS